MALSVGCEFFELHSVSVAAADNGLPDAAADDPICIRLLKVKDADDPVDRGGHA